MRARGGVKQSSGMLQGSQRPNYAAAGPENSVSDSSAPSVDTPGPVPPYSQDIYIIQR